MSWEYHDALLGLRQRQQRKAIRTARQFERNPRYPSLRYKPVQGAGRHIYSFRVDRDYRTIVQHGDPHLFLYVANHDDAYDWARRHRCEVHPETGTLQTFQPRSTDLNGEGAEVLFPELRGRQLRRLGVPEAMIYEVLSLADEAALEEFEDRLPSSAYDALLSLYLNVQSYDELVLDVEDPDEAEETATNRISDLQAGELRRLGVPDAMIAEVRALECEAALEETRDRLPVEAYEALFYYLAGDAYEDLIRQREPPTKVDTDDVSTALERPTSKQRFWVVDEALDQAFRNGLEQWRTFLHPEQRALVERNWNGSVYVKGEPGTGKTVVAMHRARWLAQNLQLQSSLFGPAPRPDPQPDVLLLTFNVNLAKDIRANLETICSPREMARIEVTNLDRWVVKYLGRKLDHDFCVVFDRTKPPWNDVWQEALSRRDLARFVQGGRLTESFYADELDHVILPRGIETEEGYKGVRRKGRGTRLLEDQRTRVWKVFEQYRDELQQHSGRDWRGQWVQHGIEVEDAYRRARALLEKPLYSAVIVDEAQDLSRQAMRLIRTMVAPGPNDLFIVGDGFQRIYGRDRFALSDCGIDIRNRSRKLTINYRTTAEIREWATRLVENRGVRDLDDKPEQVEPSISQTHGPVPEVWEFDSCEEQAEFIVERFSGWTESGERLRDTCIVARTKRERNKVKQALEAADFECVVLRKQPPLIDRGGVRLATLHRVKGLEFDRMILVSLNKGLVPLGPAIWKAPDKEARERAETQERSLVFVAATRARKEVLALSYGTQSPFVRPT